MASNAQEIHDQLEPIANELISDITEAAQDGAVSLTQLVREGRHRDARLRADLDVNIAKLAALQNLRDIGRLAGVEQHFGGRRRLSAIQSAA